jgi:tripartite-type tricarboxylate transporter receptor subunit TctC
VVATYLRLVVSASLLFALPVAALGQSAWPSKPIRFVIPFPAGGHVDVAARILSEKISPALGQPILVENRTGADGIIATEYVAKSPNDGHIWLAQAVPFTVMPNLRPRQLRYDTARDFHPVALFATTSIVYVVPATLPVKSVKEFIAYAKARRGKISYGGSSKGSLAHLGGEMLKQAADIEMEMIPYAGMPPAISDLISERTQIMALGISLVVPHIKAGKLRAIAVLDAQRHGLLPDVPSITEAGYPNLEMTTWFGILVPAGTPADVVQRINKEVMLGIKSSDVADRYRKVGIEPAKPNTPQEFDAFIKNEIARWGRVMKEAKIEPEQ